MNNTAADYRAILELDSRAERADIVVSYRRLAMRWHPDRNDSPQAKEKFQQIQTAYRKLIAMHAPRRTQDLWDEAFHGSTSSAQRSPVDAPHPNQNSAQDNRGMQDENDDGGAIDAGTYHEGFWVNFPFLSVLCLLTGIVAFAAMPTPSSWFLLSLAVMLANNVYVTGGAVTALRTEATFRLAVRLYFVVLLGGLVVRMFATAIGF